MWKCPNCETTNNTKFCVVCGKNQPDSNELLSDLENTNEKNKQLKNLVIISSLVAVSLIVSIIAFFVVRGIYYKNLKEEERARERLVETQEPAISTQAPIDPPTISPTEAPPVQNLSGIKEITSIDTKMTSWGDSITISTSSEASPQVQHLHSPERIVIDFYGFEQVMGGTQLNYSGNCFSNIRYANHDSYARVVIDLYEDKYYTVDTYANKCVIDITY